VYNALIKVSSTDDSLRVYYRRCNEKKKALVVEHPEVTNDPTIGFRDLTDKENLMFRYSC
jgi:MFS transporter, ACS family, DAL5 transporter family protein